MHVFLIIYGVTVAKASSAPQNKSGNANLFQGDSLDVDLHNKIFHEITSIGAVKHLYRKVRCNVFLPLPMVALKLASNSLIQRTLRIIFDWQKYYRRHDPDLGQDDM